MNDSRMIAEVEDSGYRSWPAREVEGYDGWKLRYADGFSRRGNSVLPVGASTVDLDVKLDLCRSWFRQRGLSLVVRITPVCEPGIDDELAMRGFTREGETHVMVSDLSAGVAGDRDLPSEELGDRWLRVMEGLWNIAPEVRPAWLGIIERIGLPAGYALLQEAAAGLGVVDRCWLGLFEIVVEPSQRRRGYGRAITSMLMDWGAGRGARGAYLQVVAANAAAIALYESLGFRYAYTYWYRRDPANSPA